MPRPENIWYLAFMNVKKRAFFQKKSFIMKWCFEKY